MTTSDAKFRVFMSVKIQVKVFGVVKPHSVVGYQRLREACCLHLRGITTQKTSTWLP